MKRNLDIVFLHPDLGIGGAERLVVDAALALKSLGHSVRFLTSHHDVTHCFEETRDGTLNVTVSGDILPRKLFGYFHAFFAYLRSFWATMYLLCCSKWNYDVIFIDQISLPIYFLSRFSDAKLIYYCHFPDQLLAKRTSFWRSLYRGPFDWLEEYTTGLADYVLVNSEFTAQTFRKTFKRLDHVTLDVLYPCVSEALLTTTSNETYDEERLQEISPHLKPNYFLSLNRFERKKNISLAIQALGVLQSKLPDEKFDNVHLVVAGGFDPVNAENSDHYTELTCLTENLRLNRHVTFLKSPSDEDKACLLIHCLCLIYTPSFEHFGIVPVEAMLCRRPVLAVNNGGPLETVVNGETGILTESDCENFAETMRELFLNPGLATKMGLAGRKRALNLFSFDVFADKLNAICASVMTGARI